MNTDTVLESEVEQLEQVPRVRNIEVWARLKKSSKYYHQGLVDPYAAKSKLEARFFKLTSFIPTRLGTALSKDIYVLNFNGNSYRIEDCELFLRSADNAKHFVRIV